MKFCFSVDVEFWAGSRRPNVSGTYGSLGRRIMAHLLKLLRQRRVPATFAFIGHLLLYHCEGHDRMNLPRLDWLARDPRSRFPLNDVWYTPDLVESILQESPDHEIACHSFSHVSFTDPLCTPDVARSELEACKEAARPFGIEMHSFVFPYNQVGHQDILVEFGFDHAACGRVGASGRPERFPDPFSRKGLVWVPRTHVISTITPLKLARLARTLQAAAAEKKFVHVYTHEWALVTRRHFYVLDALFRFVNRKADTMVLGDVQPGERL